MTSAPPANVPKALPRLANTTTSSILVTLLCQKPLTEKTSSERFSKSLTVGRKKYAWINPANKPAERRGFKEVNGAAIKAVSIANGCPKAMIVPIADKEPFHKIQLIICCHPAVGLATKV